jgi:carbamate kinase
MYHVVNDILPSMPLDVCGAESQGMIGYLFQLALDEELKSKGLNVPVATVLTRTLVSKTDRAFTHPTKPIGPFYDQREANRLRKEKGWQLVKDSGRGFRRVVPSPKPVDILEKETILRLFNSGTVVIAAGGGGVPVIRARRGFEGVEAVLDKDRTAALLATLIHADTFLLLTDVDMVYLDYMGPHRTPLRKADASTFQRYLNEGQFPAGSMGPKVESAITFLRRGGGLAVITSLTMAREALAEKAGTLITP